MLSQAISVFENRHARKFSFHELEVARKAYCLGMVDGILERHEGGLPDLYDEVWKRMSSESMPKLDDNRNRDFVLPQRSETRDI